MNKIKVAFLDRDGTITKEYEDEEWKNKTNPEFLQGTIQALKKITDLGYQIIVITNQSLIHKGIIKLEDYYKFNENLIKELKKNKIEILDIFFCPHTKEENCNCKKPKPGMILEACKKYDIDIEKSFVAGDRASDEGIAKYFNMTFFGVNYTPKDTKNKRVKNLEEIVQYIESL